MNLPLFDIPMQKGAGETGRPVDAGDAQSRVRASSDHEVEAPPQGFSRSDADGVRRAGGSEIPHFPDVRRLVQAKSGTFIEVRDGQPTGREFYLAELQDGRIVNVFTTGERESASPAMSRVLIDDAIEGRTFVEVER